MPATLSLGAGGAGDADVAVDVVQGNVSSAELQFLGRGVHPGDALLEPAAGADVAVNLCHARSISLSNTPLNMEMTVFNPCSILPVCDTGPPVDRWARRGEECRCLRKSATETLALDVLIGHPVLRVQS